MKVLGLIPARGGSKRLPGKNTRELGGHPLIAWSIRSALDSKCCNDVLVSTDNQCIAEIAGKYGADIPWMRPGELATDEASSVDVALHAIDAYEASRGPVDALLLLQPTSPFRTAASIRHAMALFSVFDGRRPLVSVKPAQTHPAWCFEVSENSMVPCLGWSELSRRSQGQKPAWALDGAIYIISPDTLRTERSFLPEDVLPFEIRQAHESMDIDTLDDFELCEMFLEMKKIAFS